MNQICKKHVAVNIGAARCLLLVRTPSAQRRIAEAERDRVSACTRALLVEARLTRADTNAPESPAGHLLARADPFIGAAVCHERKEMDGDSAQFQD